MRSRVISIVLILVALALFIAINVKACSLGVPLIVAG